MKALLDRLPTPPEGLSGWPFTLPGDGVLEPPTDAETVDWPRITLVTPSYNQAEYLEITLRSVLLQGYPNLQYLVLDGGSNDGSREILETYAPFLDHWQSEPDGGQSAAVNAGLAMGDGILVNWLNSDDYLLPGALFAVARAHLESGAARTLYAGSALRVDARGETISRLPIRWAPEVRSPFCAPLIGGVQASWFWTRELWDAMGGVDASLRYAMDVDLHLRAHLHDAQFVPIEQDLATFRIHGDAKTSLEALPAVLEREKLYWRLLGTDAFPDDAHHRHWLRRDLSGLALHWAGRAPNLLDTTRMIFYSARLYPKRLGRRDFWTMSGAAVRSRLAGDRAAEDRAAEDRA